ncbi:hypothetical protein MCOR02_000906 [Pyricularia oryzae]|nr:hypothetical protein MCOR02_000906 [Pyricularia oryzae]KAI6316911.1 hypothetical protein MCOR34_004108 [Pyricularia oryzae]KAI6453497.1 hypothetical protein MCOR17_009241 [Pyricularia oryzae]KAI6561324.1 hypothetical protein MCOR04_009536 [Pyricularia oryzae]KAI6626044.1 hypothetical protein MCOR14_008950 [Pyricularia oryzae]
MAHRQLQAAEMATANSPIASRTRKRGVGNMGTSNNVNPQTTVAAPAPSRAAKPKAAAPVAQVSIMATPEATAPTPGLVSNTAATPGTFRPTFGRRFAPRDETDTRSVRSLPSAAPDQSQIDEYDMNTSQYQAGTPSVVAREASMAPSDAFYTPGGVNGQMGVARALEKNLPKLVEAATELHQLLSDPERNSQETQEEDTVWIGELSVAHTILNALKRPYCSQGVTYIRDTEDLCERLQYTYGHAPFETAKTVASIVNLSELMYDFTFLRDAPEEHIFFLGRLDKYFPAVFIPIPLLGRGEWEKATLALAVDIRTQLAISRLRELESGQSAIEVLGDVFLEYVDKEAELDEQLALPQSYRGLPGCDSVQYRFKELPAIGKSQEQFCQRCQEIKELVGQHVNNVPEVISKIEEHFDFAGFRSVLQSWIGGVTTDLMEMPLNQGPFDPNLGTPASTRLRESVLGRSPYSPAASADAVQAFIRLGMAGQHIASPSPVNNSRAGIARGQKRPRPTDDGDDDDDFEQDQRIPDSQSMPPPPPPVRRRRRTSGSRAKRVQMEPQIPVDPILTAGDSAQYPAPPESIVDGAHDGNNSTTTGLDNASDAFASPAPSSVMNVATAPNLLQMSQHARAISALARQRNPKPPQTRVPWSIPDCQRLIGAVGAYDAKWSKIAEAIRNGQVPLEHPRDQQALRDKARLIKQDMLKTDSILPPGFDLVLFGRKENEAVINVGKNPHRKESDIDPTTGRPVNTEWVDPNAPPPPPPEEQDGEQQQQQEPLTTAEEAVVAAAEEERQEHEPRHYQRHEQEQQQLEEHTEGQQGHQRHEQGPQQLDEHLEQSQQLDEQSQLQQEDQGQEQEQHEASATEGAVRMSD